MSLFGAVSGAARIRFALKLNFFVIANEKADNFDISYSTSTPSNSVFPSVSVCAYDDDPTVFALFFRIFRYVQ